jgi:hypothetical protein
MRFHISSSMFSFFRLLFGCHSQRRLVALGLVFVGSILVGDANAFEGAEETKSKVTIVKDPKPQPYPMRDIPIDSPRFLKIFDLAAKTEEELARSAIHSFRVIQTVSPGRFLAHTSSGRQTVLLHLPDQAHADDTWVRIRPVFTKDLYEYVSVIGAKNTVEIVKEAPEPREFTPIELREKLMIGHTYQVEVLLPESSCESCNGFGRIPVRHGKRTGDGRQVCSRCKGSGKIQTLRRLIIEW